MTRAERVATVSTLRWGGLNGVEVAERLGISRSYCYALLTDPTGKADHARKMKGTCQDCGTATRSDGAGNHPQLRCIPCQKAWQTANKKWTRERIIAAIQEWEERFGSAPSASSWNLGLATPTDKDRFRAGDYPGTSSVANEFGRFGHGLAAAGFPSSNPLAGKPRNRVSEDEYRAMEEMRDRGMTLREIGAKFGLTPNAAGMRLRHRKDPAVPTSLKAETVIEREIKRYEDRKQQAEATAKEAGEQAERLRAALAALNNGHRR